MFDTKVVFNWLVNDSEELDLNRERAKLAQKQREKTALQVEEMKGELVSAEEVKTTWSGFVANCRAKLLSIPIKAAPDLVGADSLAVIQKILKRHVTEALSELAG
jgi:phage terminase Nu1 subunit (DNA packaging protein)